MGAQKQGGTGENRSVQQEEQQVDSAGVVVRRFYEEYITDWLRPKREKAEAIQKQYLTQRLFDRLQNMYRGMELDYDPFLEAQDCDVSVLENLRIEIDTVQSNVYRVYLWDNYNRNYKEVRLLLRQEKHGYKIDAVSSLPE